MRASIAGVLVVAGVASACTQGANFGTARYSAEPRVHAPQPVVVRRNVPTWPTASSEVAAAPAPYASRTVAPQPIVLSSRPEAAPAPRTRTASEIAARLRPINATCPVMLGAPVDGSVTTSYNGRVVAFADVASRSRWLGDPDRYARNLPGSAGFGSASDGPVFAAAAPPPSPMRSSRPLVSAPLASPELPVLDAPPAALPPAAFTRASFAPAASAASAATIAPVAAPVAPVARACPAAPAPTVAAPAPVAPAATESDAGGTCPDGDCPGGNCKLPPRRK